MIGNSHLRTQLDGNDSFVSGGHGVISTAGATLHASRMKRVPVWALDDEKIKEILLSAFPKLHTNPKQREAAARWLRIIHLYWRTGLTRAQVAHEIHKTEVQTQSLIRSISRIVEGKRANGTGMKNERKVGRPKKIRAPIGTPLGSSGDDSHISL